MRLWIALFYLSSNLSLIIIFMVIKQVMVNMSETIAYLNMSLSGQGGLACCSPWGCKESDTSEWLNWIELICITDVVWK